MPCMAHAEVHKNNAHNQKREEKQQHRNKTMLVKLFHLTLHYITLVTDFVVYLEQYLDDRGESGLIYLQRKYLNPVGFLPLPVAARQVPDH